ncbi:MAG: BACON domain-containing protein [Rikenellaceae bacterium]|jgi:hypothetical protein|nr:BACON domain-containing protein [Rikenellaceae bacterium]HNS29262.1 BACON domain-containing protein [Tenuifilaceae bacterium]HPK78190.1 BACON domain-containing protein [Tenuifilaceae bacterium]
MDILIDNINLLSKWGINVMNYTTLFDIAEEKTEFFEWQDKSGVQKGDTNSRYAPIEIKLECYIVKSTELLAYKELVSFTDYLFYKNVGYGNGVSVLSIVYSTDRLCFLVDRMKHVSTSTNIQAGRAILIFELELRIVNPRAKTFTVSNSDEATINYGNRERSMIYWGDGASELLERAGTYSHTYKAKGDYCVIIDIDKQDYLGTLPDAPISISPDTVNKNRKGGEEELLVTCADDWQIDDIPTWAHFENLAGLTITGGIGNEIIKVFVKENNSHDDRSAEVKFRTVSREAVLTINQSGYIKRTTGVEDRTTGVEVRIVN